MFSNHQYPQKQKAYTPNALPTSHRPTSSPHHLNCFGNIFTWRLGTIAILSSFHVLQ